MRNEMYPLKKENFYDSDFMQPTEYACPVHPLIGKRITSMKFISETGEVQDQDGFKIGYGSYDDKTKVLTITNF